MMMCIRWMCSNVVAVIDTLCHLLAVFEQ